MPGKLKNHIGLRFGSLVIESVLPQMNKHGQKICIAKCDCGGSIEVLVGSLVTGNTRSCGCIKPPINESVSSYGRLRITKFLPYSPGEKRLVEASCECGSKRTYRLEAIRIGNTTSCGCAESTIHTSFDEDDQKFFYWAGFVGADGCIRGRIIYITIHEKDELELFQFSQIIQHSPSLIRFNGRPHVGVVVHSDRISNRFREAGIAERKSLTYDPPEKFASNKHFWRGMIDGDGSLMWHGNSPVLKLCGSEQSCVKFMEWAKEILGKSHTIHKADNIRYVCIYGKSAIRIAAELYGDHPEYFLKRKYDMFISFLENKPKRNI